MALSDLADGQATNGIRWCRQCSFYVLLLSAKRYHQRFVLSCMCAACGISSLLDHVGLRCRCPVMFVRDHQRFALSCMCAACGMSSLLDHVGLRCRCPVMFVVQ